MDRGKDPYSMAGELQAPLLPTPTRRLLTRNGQHAPKALESAVMATVILPTVCSDVQKPGSR